MPPLTAPPRRCAKASEANIASAKEVTPRIPNLVIVFILFSQLVTNALELGNEPRPAMVCLFSRPATAWSAAAQNSALFLVLRGMGAFVRDPLLHFRAIYGNAQRCVDPELYALTLNRHDYDFDFSINDDRFI